MPDLDPTEPLPALYDLLSGRVILPEDFDILAPLPPPTDED
jgi:hypothetical protein